MSFANFTNPYRNPADVPEDYRKHPAIARRFRPDGTYLNTLEDPVTLWAIDILHREYGVPLDAMEVEAVATTDRTDKTTSRQAFGPEVHAELTRSQLQPGDVLLTTVGSIGIAAVVDGSLGEANINQNLVKLTPKPNINPYYLASFLNSSIGRIQTERTASKSVVPIVSYPRLRNILIPIPPRSIQDDVEKYMRNTLLKVRNLRSQAETVVTAAKARVERMILGEETVE